MFDSPQLLAYQILYIFKHTNTVEYVHYLNTMSQKQIPDNSKLENVIFLLNIDQYLDNVWSASEIELINESLSSVLDFDSTVEYSMLLC